MLNFKQEVDVQWESTRSLSQAGTVYFLLSTSIGGTTNRPRNTQREHNYAKPSLNETAEEMLPDELNDETAEELLQDELNDHTYCSISHQYLLVIQQYADDISWVSNNKLKLEIIKRNIPRKLNERNLHVNQAKTEHYEIKRNGDETCKNAYKRRCNEKKTTRYGTI